MSGRIVELTKAITRHLQLGQYSTEVAVERRWVPLFAREELRNDYAVQVIPENEENAAVLNRNGVREHIITISVFCTRAVDFRKLEEVDIVADVMEEIYDRWCDLRFIEASPGVVATMIACQIDPLVDHMRMADQRVFTGRIQGQYKVVMGGC